MSEITILLTQIMDNIPTVLSLGWGRLSLGPQAIVSGLIMGMIYALVAAGLAIIWGVVDIVNFAHGEYMLIAMYFTLVASNMFAIDPLLMVPVNTILLFVIGYMTYKMIISRVMDAPMLAQIFATFGLLLVLRFGILVIAGPSTSSISNFVFSGYWRPFGFVITIPQLVTAIVSIITLVLLFTFMKYTKTGMAIRATAQDRGAAQAMGIDSDHIYAVSWGIGIAAAGIAGTLVATFNPIQPELTPTTWTLIAFASVALGGFGSVLGAVAGGIVIGLVENVGAVLLDPSYRMLYVFLVFIGVLLFKPEGILNWNEEQ